VDVYTNVLEKKKVEKNSLEDLEVQLEAEDIIQYRKRALAIVASKPKEKGFFSSWFSSSKEVENPDELNAEQERQKVLNPNP
jgi:hypothetical protein